MPGAVFLIGFMGAGKTSVGQALARRLNWLFEDLDQRIERNQGRSVAEIFQELGESEFRAAEHSALKQLLEEISGKPGKIVALGGGAFAQRKNAALLEWHGAHVVLLDAPIEVLWQRCCKQASEDGSSRPLLRDLDQFRELYQARRRSYGKARLTVRTESRKVDDIAAKITRLLNLKKTNARTGKGNVQ